MIQPPRVREEVVGDVVDGVVLDHDHALRELAEDEPFPGETAGQRDDERRHAEERHERPLKRSDRDADEDGEQDRDHTRELVRAPGQLQLGDGDAGEAADEADGEVDLTEQQDEDDPERDRRGSGRLDDQVVEVRGADEVRVLGVEEHRDQRDRDDDRRRSDLARANVLPPPPQATAIGPGLRAGGGSVASGTRLSAVVIGLLRLRGSGPPPGRQVHRR